MLFALIGFYKPGAEPHIIDIRDEVSEYLGQPFGQPKLAGALRDDEGRRVGNMLLMEADTFEEAQKQLSHSPFHQHGFYERTEVVEYVIEVGRLTTT